MQQPAPNQAPIDAVLAFILSNEVETYLLSRNTRVQLQRYPPTGFVMLQILNLQGTGATTYPQVDFQNCVPIVLNNPPVVVAMPVPQNDWTPLSIIIQQNRQPLVQPAYYMPNASNNCFGNADCQMFNHLDTAQHPMQRQQMNFNLQTQELNHNPTTEAFFQIIQNIGSQGLIDAQDVPNWMAALYHDQHEEYVIGEMGDADELFQTFLQHLNYTVSGNVPMEANNRQALIQLLRHRNNVRNYFGFGAQHYLINANLHIEFDLRLLSIPQGQLVPLVRYVRSSLQEYRWTISCLPKYLIFSLHQQENVDGQIANSIVLPRIIDNFYQWLAADGHPENFFTFELAVDPSLNSRYHLASIIHYDPQGIPKPRKKLKKQSSQKTKKTSSVIPSGGHYTTSCFHFEEANYDNFIFRDDMTMFTINNIPQNLVVTNGRMLIYGRQDVVPKSKIFLKTKTPRKKKVQKGFSGPLPKTSKTQQSQQTTA